MASAAAAAVAAIPTCPMDVVKTRMQVQLDTPARSVGKALVHLYRHEGMAALFAGVFPRVIKVAPSCAIIICGFELGKVQCARLRTHLTT